MIWLLDVSVLAARLIEKHEHRPRVLAWLPGRSIALCPISELGFLRVACAMGGLMSEARSSLEIFIELESPSFIPCDRRVLENPFTPSARKTTDIYLADLAQSRGWRLITLDRGIDHPAVDLIPD